MLQKIYGADPEGEHRYSPAQCIGVRSDVISGDPDVDHISTSYVERQNLTMRMHMRRYTRLTIAFSKKLANHGHMVALYSVWYNFVKLHKTLKCSPAMEAKVTDRLFSVEDLVAITDEWEAQQPRAKVGRKPKGN